MAELGLATTFHLRGLPSLQSTRLNSARRRLHFTKAELGSWLLSARLRPVKDTWLSRLVDAAEVVMNSDSVAIRLAELASLP